MPGDLGFALQNRGSLFALDDEHPNRLEPHKRPFHTIIPAMVTKDGKPWFCFGVMGGDMQPQGHVQVLVNMIDFGMNVQEAGDAARVRHAGSASPPASRPSRAGTVTVEAGHQRRSRRANCENAATRSVASAAAASAATKASSSTGSTACCTAAPSRAKTAPRWGIEGKREAEGGGERRGVSPPCAARKRKAESGKRKAESGKRKAESGVSPPCLVAKVESGKRNAGASGAALACRACQQGLPAQWLWGDSTAGIEPLAGLLAPALR